MPLLPRSSSVKDCSSWTLLESLGRRRRRMVAPLGMPLQGNMGFATVVPIVPIWDPVQACCYISVRAPRILLLLRA